MPETLSGQRAQDKVLQMQAHANAIDTLMENGTIVTPGEDPLDAQLQQLSMKQNVDVELAAMRQQLKIASPPQQPQMSGLRNEPPHQRSSSDTP